MMDKDRSLLIHKAKNIGNVVVYIMSRDQRVRDNFALLEAQRKAIELSQPLIVLFNLRIDLVNRAYEHFNFMIKGLEEVSAELESLNIPFLITADRSDVSLLDSLKKIHPSVLYFDFSPSYGARDRIKLIAKRLNVTSYVIDAHNIIPAWVASDKREFAAHAFRRKVHRLLSIYLTEPDQISKHPFSNTTQISGLSFSEVYQFISSYPKRDITVIAIAGEKVAHEHLSKFIRDKLNNYALKRNDIAIDFQSGLSPYLHFGQIASIRIALDVLSAVGSTPLLFNEARMASPSQDPSSVDGMNALFEELIVRKELSDNYCFYNDTDYKTINSAPKWAISSLNQHKTDAREYLYDYATLECAKTHDKAWNAAQKELTSTGKMHGYMRMYWAKKILEWTSSVELALKYAIKLNDSYSIDGMDPNGYVGILWSMAGLHDRPWIDRPIFGKIRYMNEAGLKRKFDLEKYIQRIG